MRRHRSVCLLALTTLVVLLPAAPARALCPATGGANETSEPMAATRAWLGGATPGVVPAGLVSGELLITEVYTSGDRREFIEIYNPTGKSVGLDSYYLTDYASEDGIGTRHGYWDVVTGAAFGVDNAADFVVRFPAGASVAPGQAIVVATGASSTLPPGAFIGGTADYEIVDVSPVSNMVTVGGTPNGTLAGGLLFDNAEFVMLFKWDGACDLVCDVDYFTWGQQANGNCRADKTSLVIDGPDGDATPSAYLPDISATQQEMTPASVGLSMVRASVGLEQAGGNGCVADAVPVKVVSWGSIKAMYPGSR